jgi:hypothetical protein
MIADPGAQMRQSSLNYPERCIDIRFHRPIKLVGRNIENRCISLLSSRVANQNIQAT